MIKESKVIIEKLKNSNREEYQLQLAQSNNLYIFYMDTIYYLLEIIMFK